MFDTTVANLYNLLGDAQPGMRCLEELQMLVPIPRERELCNQASRDILGRSTSETKPDYK